MKKHLLWGAVLLLLPGMNQAQTISVEDLKIEKNTQSLAFKKANNLADSADYYEWTNGAWEFHVRRTFQYNGNGEITEAYEKDPVTFEVVNRLTYTYNSNDQLTVLLNESNQGGTFEPNIRELYTYDNEGNRVSFRAEEWDDQNSDWSLITGDSFAFVYDGQGRITEYTLFQLASGAANPTQKLIWADFNADDYPTKLTVQSYSGGFKNYIKLENLTWGQGYDYADFDPTSYYGYNWDGINQNWNPMVFDTSHVQNDVRIRKFLFQWDGTDKDSLQKTEYQYDAMGHREETIVYNYSVAYWQEVDGRRDIKDYGSYDEVTVRTKSYLEVNTLKWVNQTKEEYYYNGLSVQGPDHRPLKVYPNPTSKLVYVDLPGEIDQIELLNMDGRSTLLELENGAVNLENLPHGVYFLRAIQQGQIYSTRIIKR